MSDKFLNNIDLVQTEIQNAVVQNLGTAPSNPKAGQFYFDTISHHLLIWNDNLSVWELYASNSNQLNGQLASYYLSRANQTGTQLSSTISDLSTTVQSYPLNSFATPTGPVSFGGYRQTNVATPVNSTDGANKGYVDAAIQGLSPKPTAQAATVSPLPSNTYNNGAAGVGATLTGASNAALSSVDGYAPNAGDRILIMNEAATANNGLYVLTQQGSGTQPWILTRDVDMDQSTEFGGGLIAIENGSVNASRLYLCTTSNSITVGTTSVTFTGLINPTSYSAGNGISIAALTISAKVLANSGITLSASGLALDTTYVVRKYSTTIGDNSSTSYTVTHSLGTTTPFVTLYLASTGQIVHTTVIVANANSVTVNFASAPNSNQFIVGVQG